MLDLKTKSIKIKDIKSRQATMDHILKELDRCIVDHGCYEVPIDLMDDIRGMLIDSHDIYNLVVDNTEVFK